MFSIVFYTGRCNIKLAICFCGFARAHDMHCVLRVSGQYQTSDLLLRDRPNSCSNCVLHVLRNIKLAICFCGMARTYVSIAFYTYRGNIKLAICFCGIVRIHVFYCVLHGLGQCPSSDSLLRDRPNSCFLLCFTRIGAKSN